jgi:hypothetical protein
MRLHVEVEWGTLDREPAKVYVRKFLEWVRNQNYIARVDEGEVTVTILSNSDTNPAVTIPLEPTDEDIDGLVESFIELTPEFWNKGE